ncbi:MAG TPA: thiol reductant ABC exporter subunit CydD [Ilumatobacteraceae bacterium]|nr:thiol reductant ABC exporter subunit CydD [Ilumatobacteraceae bacterium]
MSDGGRRGPVDLRLLGLVPALRRHVAVVGVVAAATALAVVVQAGVLADGLTALVTDGDVDGGVARLSISLAAIALFRGGAVAVTEWSATRAMAAVRAGVRDAVLDHAERDGDRAASGLASREATIATTGADQLEPYVRQFLPALMLSVAVPLVAGVRILSADLLSAALVAVTVPLIPVFMVLIGRMTQRRTDRQWATLQRLGGHFLDVLEGLPTLRLFGRADAQRDSVHQVSEQYRTTTMGALRIAFLSAFALELIATLSVALIAVEIGLRLAAGSFELYPALVILLLAPECYFPIRRVGASFHAAQSGLDASDDLFELLQRPILPAGVVPAPTSGTLLLRDVELRRGGRAVTSGLDIDVAPGAVVAVFGPSGSGKSTLIEACRGRLADRRGSLTIDGVELADIEPDSWADRLAVVGQRLTPNSSTVVETVRAGSAASHDQIVAALRQVGLPDIVPDQPAADGGRRCDELSGGQLRRVQVARAIVAVRARGASIVLADEPTAHLDDAAASAVWAALDALARADGAAVLVATHDDRCRSIADLVLELTGDGGPLGHDTRTEHHAGLQLPEVPAAALPVSPAASPASSPASSSRSLPDAVRDLDPVATLPARTETTDQAPTPVGAAGAGESRWRSVRRVMVMARPARRRFAAATGLGIAAEAMTVGLAAVAAWLIVRASAQPDLAELSIAILGVRAFGTGKGVFRYAERVATHDAGLRALSEIRSGVVDRLARLAPAGIPGWERGDLLHRVVNDVDRLLDLFVRVLGPLLAVGVTAATAAVITLVLDIPAGLVLVGALGVVGLVIPLVTVLVESGVGPAIAARQVHLADRVLEHTERLDDSIAARTAHRDRQRIAELEDERNRQERRRGRLRAVTGAAIAAAPLLTVALTIIAVDPASLRAPILGVLILWPLAVLELTGTTNEAAATLPSVAASAQRVFAVLDTPEPSASPSAASVGLAWGAPPAVDAVGVVARWPGVGHDAVGPVSFHLESASHHTIVGPSGSGKSTLAAVLVGFLPLQRGAYRLDGIDAHDVADLRRDVTWLRQLPWLADSTIRENLRIADPEATDDELVEALTAVRLDQWYERLSGGLDTHIGRGGAGMSGGEAQRLALARVLLAGHRVVVLDEPTAHLDRDTAASVMATVLARCADRTTLVLGHRAP